MCKQVFVFFLIKNITRTRKNACSLCAKSKPQTKNVGFFIAVMYCGHGHLLFAFNLHFPQLAVDCDCPHLPNINTSTFKFSILLVAWPLPACIQPAQLQLCKMQAHAPNPSQIPNSQAGHGPKSTCRPSPMSMDTPLSSYRV
jgi:hypothetical protein